MEMSLCYFNHRSITLLTLLIIGIVISAALALIKRKTTPTKLLLGYYICISLAILLAFIPFCKTENISYPFEIFFSVSSGTLLTLFAYNFPTLQQPRAARIAALILPGITVIALFLCTIFEMRSLLVGSIPTAYYVFLLSFLPIFNFFVSLLVIHQFWTKRIKSKYLVAVAMLFGLLPSILPLLDFLNIINQSITDLLLFGGLPVTEILIFLAFLNHTEDTVRLNTKIISITLCFFLIAFGIASLFITNWFEIGMENDQLTKAALVHESLLKGVPPRNQSPDIVFIIAYPSTNGRRHQVPSPIYTREPTFDPYLFANANVRGPTNQTFNPPWNLPIYRRPASSSITKVSYYSTSAPFSEPTFHAYRFQIDDRIYEVGFSYNENASNLHWISIELMLLVLATTVLIEICLIFFFNAYLFKPIRSILTSIHLVNNNQLSELPILAEDEFGFVTHAFNNLLKNNKDTSASLTAANQLLEDRVKQRTEDLEMLRTITTTLNEAVTLETALKNGLQAVMNLFRIQTGWILLLDAFHKSRLAVAYNLPGQEEMLDPSKNLAQCQCIHALKKEDWHKVEMMQECSIYKPHVSIPLRIGEKPLGTINLILPTEKVLSDNDRQLLFTVGEAFSAAIDRGRLFESERKQRDLAETMMEVGSTLSSTLDIDQVIKEILNQVSRLVPYDSANVMLVKGSHAHITCARGYQQYGENVLEATNAMVFNIRETPNLRRMSETGKPWFISNTHANPGWVEYQGTEHIRSWVGAPIMAHGEVIAFFSLDKIEANYYTQEHANRLAIFAAQAGLAMENARLYTHSQEDLTREQLFHRITQSLTRAFDLPKMLQDAITRTVGLLDGDAGQVGLLNDEKTQLEFNYRYHKADVATPTLESLISLSSGDIAWDVLSRRKPILLDLTKQPKAAPHLVEANIFNAIYAPIISGDIPLGIVEIFSLNKEKQFTNRDLTLAESIGRQTGIAIENARLFKEVQKLAITDPLTGISNRGHFFTLGFQEVERAERYRHILSVIMLDLDHFKLVNDTYGHSTGDEVFKRVTQRFIELLRKIDILGRYGGEEFAIILPETDLDAALQVAERLRSSIGDQPIIIDKNISVSLTISLGVSTFLPEKSKGRRAIDNFETLLEEADAALYQAKNDGRNLARAYSGLFKKRAHRGKIPSMNGTGA